jgi:hypothetical protein
VAHGTRTQERLTKQDGLIEDTGARRMRIDELDGMISSRRRERRERRELAADIQRHQLDAVGGCRDVTSEAATILDFCRVTP